MKANRQFYNELEQSRTMDPESCQWWIQTSMEFLQALRADLILREALTDYEPIDPKAWRPSSPPPGWTWEEFEAAHRVSGHE